MSAISNYLENAWLSMLAQKQSFSPPDTYIALFTSLPNDDGSGGTEVSGNGYARVQVNQDGATAPYWGSVVQETSGKAVARNKGKVTFPTAGAKWGDVSGVAVMNGPSGGNLLMLGGLQTTRTINTGDVFEFDEDNLAISLD